MTLGVRILPRHGHLPDILSMNSNCVPAVLQVWFKNRRAKCRQQLQQQQQQQQQSMGGGKAPRVTTKLKSAKSSPPPPAVIPPPAPSSTGSVTNSNSASPPVLKKEPSPPFQQHRLGAGSGALATPSPPVTPGAYQHDAYNGFGWGSNAGSTYPQNYSPYYGNMGVDSYFPPPPSAVSHHQMTSTGAGPSPHYSSHNHLGFNPHSHHQVATPYSGVAPHQSCTPDYDKYQMV